MAHLTAFNTPQRLTQLHPASREGLLAVGKKHQPELQCLLNKSLRSAGQMGSGWPQCDLKLLGEATDSTEASNPNLQGSDMISSLHPMARGPALPSSLPPKGSLSCWA